MSDLATRILIVLRGIDKSHGEGKKSFIKDNLSKSLRIKYTDMRDYDGLTYFIHNSFA
jgi:hypothetical protein